MIEAPQQTPELEPQNQQSEQAIPVEVEKPSIKCPLRLLNDHWLTISRPQYKRTCGISSLVSIWNYQFSRLGLGEKEPITVEQAMLRLNLIGKGSVQENMRKKFKQANELTQKAENGTETAEKVQDDPSTKSLYQYIDSVDFGCFTGNDTLLKWYRVLCRLYGGSGRAYYFYKTNASRSAHQDEASAKRGLVEGLNSKGKVCFIYHAYDHYFCPVGYEFIPKEDREEEWFESSEAGEEGSEMYVMVGESSKMFPCMHVFKWSEINLDLNTYWPKFYNIRRRKEGVQVRLGKENQVPYTSTINCIMAFEKVKD